jgi:peptide chain release factor 1
MSRLPLIKIISDYDLINEKLSTTTDQKELIELSKKQKPIADKANIAKQIVTLEEIINTNQELLDSGEATDMTDMLDEEITESKTKIISLETELLALLAPADARDRDDIYLEIRGGAGGDESAIFAADLMKMYTIMCNENGLKLKVVSLSTNDVGGYKEVIAEVKGDGAYSWFKYEGGVHRVQRVPATEKQGRIHTSTASVAIMPILDDNSDFKLDLNEVEIVASTSQGAGGQSVNTTYSAIQVLHKPTGIRAQCQDERNQAQNKVKALAMLTSRVYDFFEQQRQEKEYAERKEQVGRADRSEKIRTYNFPQDRLTDHRYSYSWNQLPEIMTGKIGEVIKKIKELEGELELQKINE